MKSRNSERERERERTLPLLYAARIYLTKHKQQRVFHTENTKKNHIHSFIPWLFSSSLITPSSTVSISTRHRINLRERRRRIEKQAFIFRGCPSCSFVLFFSCCSTLCLFSVPQRFVLSPKQKKFSLFSPSSPKFIVFCACSSFGVV